MRTVRVPRKTVIVVAALAAVFVLPHPGTQHASASVHASGGAVAAGTAAVGQTASSRAARTPAQVPLSTANVRTVADVTLAARTPGNARADVGGTADARTPVTASSDAARATAPRAPVSVHTIAYLSQASGGLCSVPGIGDIGGLLGLCSLGSSGLTGDINNVCQPSLPTPEPANAGIDSMVTPPETGKQPATLYDEYGVAGDYWAATNLQCSDMTSLIGNNVAGMVFDGAKSIDRVTITVYQAAAGEGILSWLQKVTDRLITSLGKAIYFPYLAVVVILAAIWLAWQGLIRKRGTRTIEGTIWMVVACAAAIFLIGEPAEVTGFGRGVTDGVSQALNAAFAKLPSPGQTSCVPIRKGDPQVQPTSYSYTSGSTVVDQNADELWTVLVCKPWLVGEFGTSAYPTGAGQSNVVSKYGRSLLWAQAIAMDEKATPALIQAKQATYAGIASSLQANDPAVYPLFQGKQWTTRLEVAFAALFAAVVAGILILLISVTLILLKLGFLLLLIVGPFFLLVGTHPGFGRVVAMRWIEMVIGVLLKQAAVALVLSVLLYCYALIMGTSDAVLPWALKILMIALVTVAAFIYRKPFQHLFSAVGYGVIGSEDRASADLARARGTARANTVAAATLAAPSFAAYRAGRWARRNPRQAAGLALATSSGGAGAAVAAGVRAGEPGSAAGTVEGGTDGVAAGQGSAAASGGTELAGGRIAQAARARAQVTQSAAAEPPPLNLPARGGAGSSSAGPTAPRTGSASAATSAGSGSGPAVPPARQPSAPARRTGTPFFAGSSSRSQAGGSQPSRGQASRAQPARRQSGEPGRGQAPARGGARPARAQQGQPRGRQPRTAQPGPRPPAPGRDPDQSASWQGQPVNGPLAQPPADPPRRVPFWLRPFR